MNLGLSFKLHYYLIRSNNITFVGIAVGSVASICNDVKKFIQWKNVESHYIREEKCC